MNKFKGTGVALVTPFAENGKLDYNGLEKLVKFQINNYFKSIYEFKKFNDVGYNCSFSIRFI